MIMGFLWASESGMFDGICHLFWDLRCSHIGNILKGQLSCPGPPFPLFPSLLYLCVRTVGWPRTAAERPPSWTVTMRRNYNTSIAI